MTTTNPTLLKMPLARDGDKTTIPETAGSTTGDFSQQYGFQEINQLPLGAGGMAPKRNDFNGVFNLLSNINFYAQKGWTFHYDASQDYYLGCVVIDPADGNRYECIADMAAGTVAPHEDADGDYWRRYTLGDYEHELAGKANITGSNLVHHRDVITTSGTYTAPVTGLYKITVTGGGSGGYGGAYDSSMAVAGFGGAQGGTTIAYERMEIGDTATVIIGAGGAGGAGRTNHISSNAGSAGGDSSVTVNSTTYTGGGGRQYMTGGNGTIPGLPGQTGMGYSSGASVQGGRGGGPTGAHGSGGVGGGAQRTVSAGNGASGVDGIVIFEYYTPGA